MVSSQIHLRTGIIEGSVHTTAALSDSDSPASGSGRTMTADSEVMFSAAVADILFVRELDGISFHLVFDSV